MSTIINLYDSNYPITVDQMPNWSELPLGHFEVETRRLKAVLSGKQHVFSGHYIHAYGGRPRTGEHLLVAFAVQDTKYIYQATLSYEILDVHRKIRWWAHLGFSRCVKTWSASSVF